MTRDSQTCNSRDDLHIRYINYQNITLSHSNSIPRGNLDANIACLTAGNNHHSKGLSRIHYDNSVSLQATIKKLCSKSSVLAGRRSVILTKITSNIEPTTFHSTMSKLRKTITVLSVAFDLHPKEKKPEVHGIPSSLAQRSRRSLDGATE